MNTNIIEGTLNVLLGAIGATISEVKDLRKRCNDLADVILAEEKDGIDRSEVRLKLANRIKKEIPK